MKKLSQTPVGGNYQVFSMSKLMRASKWAEREFEPCSRPTNKTIRGWIDEGIIQGTVIHKDVYVCSDFSFNREIEVNNAVQSLIEMS